jgi:hypothetical protein
MFIAINLFISIISRGVWTLVILLGLGVLVYSSAVLGSVSW